MARLERTGKEERILVQRHLSEFSIHKVQSADDIKLWGLGSACYQLKKKLQGVEVKTCS